VTNIKYRAGVAAGLAVAVIVGGCGGSSPSEGPGDDASGGGSAVGELLGTFSVQLIAPRIENDGTTTPGYDE
jgi:hypothetical protein